MSADISIVGAGPAGLSLAIELTRMGAEVELLDEQPEPGGQIYRSAGRNGSFLQLLNWLGTDYAKGAHLIGKALSAKGITWRLSTSLWDIRCEEDAIELGLLHNEKTFVTKTRYLVLATGAMERPTVFPGWTLPGVMSIGAAQSLLKDAALLPQDGVVLAGQGPLLYLFAHQLLEAGIRPAFVLDLSAKWGALRHPLQLSLAAALAPGPIMKGLKWRNEISRAGIPHYFGVRQIEAIGEDALRRVRFGQFGQMREIDASLLLVHDGVIPNTHISRAAGCAHDWHDVQKYWMPRRDGEGQTSQKGLFVLGDGAEILGAEGAELQGRILARSLARRLGLAVVSAKHDQSDKWALRKTAMLRRFLDLAYRPSDALGDPPDPTMVCRCEAITAGEIRDLVRLGCMGPNQMRAFSRAGMGPCMGRMCGPAINQIIAQETGQNVADIGQFSIRPPLKPVTLAQIATLKKDQDYALYSPPQSRSMLSVSFNASKNHSFFAMWKIIDVVVPRY